MRQLATMKLMNQEEPKPSVEGPVVQKISNKGTKPVSKENPGGHIDVQPKLADPKPSNHVKSQPSKHVLGKGKQKVEGIKINENATPRSTQQYLHPHVPFQIESALEKAKKESEALAKELEEKKLRLQMQK